MKMEAGTAILSGNGDRNPLLSATYDYQREYVNRASTLFMANMNLLKT